MPPRNSHAASRWAIRACCAGCAALLVGTPIGIGAEPSLVLTEAQAAPKAVPARNAETTGVAHKPSMVMLMLFGSGARSQSLFGRLGQ